MYWILLVPVCWFLLWLVCRAIWQRVSDRNTEGDGVAENEAACRAERVRLLEQIHSLPTCPDGTLSDPQKRLWAEYHKLERIGGL